MVQTPTNIARDVKKYFLKIPHDIGQYLCENSRKSIFCKQIHFAVQDLSHFGLNPELRNRFFHKKSIFSIFRGDIDLYRGGSLENTTLRPQQYL